jgi:hypothetical protein
VTRWVPYKLGQEHGGINMNGLMTARKTAQKRFVVWVELSKGHWMPSPAMSQQQANAYMEEMEGEGKVCRVVPVPRMETEDLE